MGLLGVFSKIAGTGDKAKWSQSKKIAVAGPDFFGKYFIYVDPNFNVAIFLPKSDGTLHVLTGDISQAHRWIKCDQRGKRLKDKVPPEGAFQWKIHPRNIRYAGTGFPPDKPGYRGRVIFSREFFDFIDDQWINKTIKEHARMMSAWAHEIHPRNTREASHGEVRSGQKRKMIPTRGTDQILGTHTLDRYEKRGEAPMVGQNQREEGEEVDALCPECGHAFKRYVDRLVDGTGESGLKDKIECPVCGCGECDIVRSGA